MRKRRPFPHHGKRASLFALFSLDSSLFRYPFAVRKDKQKFIDAFLKEMTAISSFSGVMRHAQG